MELSSFLEEVQDDLLKDWVSLLIDYISKRRNQLETAQLQNQARLVENIGQAKLKYIPNDADSPREKEDAGSELNQQIQGNLLPSP